MQISPFSSSQSSLYAQSSAKDRQILPLQAANSASSSAETINLGEKYDHSQAMQSLFNLSYKPAPGQVAVSIDDISAGANSAAKNLEGILQNFFASNGIPSNPPIQFTTNPTDGSLQVKGPPNADKITELLKNS